ncbi:relaxase/mobilization nuclease domain-containing protein [Clostridiales bacterium VE202-28]|uniref:relaxase/mobilization nuclease domain-containing protein n=1 Tax=Enterocloster sp. OA13 TaxID=2914161 RepID=UPI0009DD63F0
MCYATHKDKNDIHTHIIVNFVRFEIGKKFNYNKKSAKDERFAGTNISQASRIYLSEK